MKAKLFYLMFLIGIGSQLHANFFDTSTKLDRLRIANTFIGFYEDNYAFLVQWEEKEFNDQEILKVITTQMLKNQVVLVRLYENNIEEFCKRFFQLEDYIKNNFVTLKDELGENKLVNFVAGVYYMEKVLCGIK